MDKPETRFELFKGILQTIGFKPRYKMHYDKLVDLRSMLEEILQAIIWEKDLSKCGFSEYNEETRLSMEIIDTMVWDYMVRTGDSCGAKQVLRDASLSLWQGKDRCEWIFT